MSNPSASCALPEEERAEAALEPSSRSRIKPIAKGLNCQHAECWSAKRRRRKRTFCRGMRLSPTLDQRICPTSGCKVANKRKTRPLSAKKTVPLRIEGWRTYPRPRRPPILSPSIPHSSSRFPRPPSPARPTPSPPGSLFRLREWRRGLTLESRAFEGEGGEWVGWTTSGGEA